MVGATATLQSFLLFLLRLFGQPASRPPTTLFVVRRGIRWCSQGVRTSASFLVAIAQRELAARSMLTEHVQQSTLSWGFYGLQQQHLRLHTAVAAARYFLLGPVHEWEPTNAALLLRFPRNCWGCDTTLDLSRILELIQLDTKPNCWPPHGARGEGGAYVRRGGLHVYSRGRGSDVLLAHLT